MTIILLAFFRGLIYTKIYNLVKNYVIKSKEKFIMINSKNYSNGLRLMHKQLPNVKSFTLMVYTIFGSRDEEKGEEGLAHLLEHMFFKSTKTRTTKEVLYDLESLGYYNAQTSREYTRFYISTLNTNVEKCFNVLSDCYCFPLYKEDDLTPERETVCSEIDYYADKHGTTSFNVCMEELFKNSQLAHSVIGTKEVVKSATSETLHRLHDKFYTTGRTIIITAGDIPFETIEKLTEKYFVNNIKTQEEAQEFEDKELILDLNENKYVFTKRDTEQFYLMAALKGQKQDLKTYYTENILLQIMGGSLCSRLSQNLREKNGLVYGVSSSYFLLKDIKLNTLDFTCNKDKAQKALELVKETSKEMETGNITDSELELAKSSFKTSLAMNDEKTFTLVLSMVSNKLYLKKDYNIDETFKYIDSVTLEDINNMAKDYFTNKKYIVSVVAKEDTLNPLDIWA